MEEYSNNIVLSDVELPTSVDLPRISVTAGGAQEPEFVSLPDTPFKLVNNSVPVAAQFSHLPDIGVAVPVKHHEFLRSAPQGNTEDLPAVQLQRLNSTVLHLVNRPPLEARPSPVIVQNYAPIKS